MREAHGCPDACIPLGVPAFVTPIVVSLMLSDRQGRLALEERAFTIATEVLRDTVAISDQVVGVEGIQSQRLLFQHGTWRPQWLERLGQDIQAIWVDQDYVVAMKRSATYNYAAYAAIPVTVIAPRSRQHLLWMLPVGMLAGLILVLCIYFEAMQQIGLPAQLSHALRKRDLRKSAGSRWRRSPARWRRSC